MTSKKFTCFTLCYVGSQEIIVRRFPSSWLCVLLLLWCKVTRRRQRCDNVSKFDISMQHKYIPRNVSLCFSRHLPIFIIEKLQKERHIVTILLLINMDKYILNINNIILGMNCLLRNSNNKHIFVCNEYCRQEN